MPTTDDVIIAGIPSPTLLDLFGTVSEKEIGIMTIPSYNSWLGKLNDSPYKTSGPTGAWAGEWWSIYNYLQYGGICVVGSTGSLGNNNLVDLDIIFNDGLSDTMFLDSIELTKTRKDCLGFLGTQKNLKSFTTNVYNKSVKFKDFTDVTRTDDIVLSTQIDGTNGRSSIQSSANLAGDKKDAYLPETEISYLVPFLDYSTSSEWLDGSKHNKTEIYYNSDTKGFILNPFLVKKGFSKNVLSGVTGISAGNISIGPNHIAVVTSTGGYTAFESSFNTETKFRTTPPSGLTGIKSVAVGYHHTCVVTAGGNVVCWGQEDRDKAYSQTGYNIPGVNDSVPIGLIYGTARKSGHPVGSTGTRTVSATTPNGQVSIDNLFTYTTNSSFPTITTSVNPNTGAKVGGTTITITGTNLTGTSSVTIDGVAATSVTVVSSTSVTCVSPVGSAGSKTITLTTPNGTATSLNAFRYIGAPTISSVNPNTGINTGGTTITITGTNLTGVTLNIGTTDLETTQVSSTSATAVTSNPFTKISYGIPLTNAGNDNNTTTNIPPPLVPVRINGITLTDIIQVFSPTSYNFDEIKFGRSGFSNFAVSSGGTYYGWGIGGGSKVNFLPNNTFPISDSYTKINSGDEVNYSNQSLINYINNHKTAYSRFQLTAHSLSNSITPLNNITSLDYNNVDYITHFDTISSKNTGITQDWKFYEDYMMVFKDKKVKSIKNLHSNIIDKIVIDKSVKNSVARENYVSNYKGGISLYNNGRIDAFGSLAGLCSSTTNFIVQRGLQNKFLHVGGSTLDFNVYNIKMNSLGVTCTNVYASDHSFIAISNNNIYYTNTMADIVINQQQKWYEPIQWPLGTTLTNVIDAKTSYNMIRLNCEGIGGLADNYSYFTFIVAILQNKNVVVIPSGAVYRSSIDNSNDLNSYLIMNSVAQTEFHNQYLGTNSNGNGITLSGGTTYGSVIKISGQTLSDVTQTCCGLLTSIDDGGAYIIIQNQILALKTDGSVVHWGNSNNKNIPQIANNSVVYLESAVNLIDNLNCADPAISTAIDTRYVALKTDGSVVSWLMSDGNDNYLHYPGPYTSVSTNFNGPFAVNMKGDIEVLYSTDDYLKLENENYLSFDKVYAHSHYIIATTKNDKFRILDYYKNFLNNQDYRFVNKPDYSTTEGSNYYTNDNNLCFFSDKKQIISPWTNTTVNIATNTDAAGCIARLSTSKDRWKPFSGISRGSLLNTLPNPINEFSTTNNDENYLNAVYNKTKNHNDVVFLNGNKLAAHLFSFDNSDKINETYVLILLKKKIKSVFKKYAFELNNESIRSNLKSDVNSELDKILNYNAISSYTLVCDETNNTPSKIKTGSLFVDITLKFPGIIDNIVLNCVIDGNKITI